jgi:nucleotide-binding universal stress UspA family protein
LKGPFELTKNPPEVQKLLVLETREKIFNLLGESPFRIRVSPCLGQADFGVIEGAVEEKADLIVTGSSQTHGLARLWHRSVSRGLLHYAPMSVLVVPAEPAPTGPKMEGLQPEAA